MATVVVALVVLGACAFIVRRVIRAIASARKPTGGCNDCSGNAADTNDWVAPR